MTSASFTLRVSPVHVHNGTPPIITCNDKYHVKLQLMVTCLFNHGPISSILLKICHALYKYMYMGGGLWVGFLFSFFALSVCYLIVCMYFHVLYI